MSPPRPSAKRRAAEETASPVSLASSLGLQIGQQLHQAKYSMVTFSPMLETCFMPEVWSFIIFHYFYYFICFYCNFYDYFFCILFCF